MLASYTYRLLPSIFLISVAMLSFLLGYDSIGVGILLIGLLIDIAFSFEKKSTILGPIVILSVFISCIRLSMLLLAMSPHQTTNLYPAILIFCSSYVIHLAMVMLNLYGQAAIAIYPLHNFSGDDEHKVHYLTKQLSLARDYKKFWFKLRIVPELLAVTTAYFYASNQLFTATAFFLSISILGIMLYRAIKAYYFYISSDYRTALKSSNMYNPEIIVYVSGPVGTAYQINQWLSVLEKLPQRVLILFQSYSPEIGFYGTTLPVLVARTLMNVERTIGPNTRLVLYPSNAQANASVLRITNLKHIFINHGESDKSVNTSKFLRSYDALYVAGEMAKQRLQQANIDIYDKSIVYVGRPQLELSLKQSSSGQPINTILYAPTWEGFAEQANYTSIGNFSIEFIKQLCSNYRVIFKPHPFTGMVKPGLKQAIQQIIRTVTSSGGSYCPTDNIHDLMNQSDLLIGDVSSVINDYLYTNKPFIITNPSNIPPTDFVKEFPTNEAGYILSPTDDIHQLINTIASDDPKSSTRKNIKSLSLGDFPEGSLQRFTDQLAMDMKG